MVAGSGGSGCSIGGTHVQIASPNSYYAAPYDGVITSWGSRGMWNPLTLKVARLGQAKLKKLRKRDAKASKIKKAKKKVKKAEAAVKAQC